MAGDTSPSAGGTDHLMGPAGPDSDSATGENRMDVAPDPGGPVSIHRSLSVLPACALVLLGALLAHTALQDPSGAEAAAKSDIAGERTSSRTEHSIEATGEEGTADGVEHSSPGGRPNGDTQRSEAAGGGASDETHDGETDAHQGKAAEANPTPTPETPSGETPLGRTPISPAPTTPPQYPTPPASSGRTTPSPTQPPPAKAPSESTPRPTTPPPTSPPPTPNEPPAAEPVAVEGDLNGDGRLDTRDVDLFNDFYDSGDLRADLDGDGELTLHDLAVLILLFNE